MITEVKRSRPKSRTVVPELFRCSAAPARGLTVLAAADRRAIDAALAAVRDWAATRDDGPALDESALTMLAAVLYRTHVAPLRAELVEARAELDVARRAAAAAEAELTERRETERSARVRREMAAERRNPQLREQVRERDGDSCRYCGSDVTLSTEAGPATAALDQVAPDVAAGADNLVMACKPCRRRKGARTLDEAGMKLLPVPESPRVAELTTPTEADAAEVTEAHDLIPIANPRTGRRLLALPRADAVAWAEGILAQCRASERADDDEPRCPECGEPERLLKSGYVGHCGDNCGSAYYPAEVSA